MAAEPVCHRHYIRSDELGQEITELCAYINAATHELLLRRGWITGDQGTTAGGLSVNPGNTMG